MDSDYASGWRRFPGTRSHISHLTSRPNVNDEHPGVVEPPTTNPLMLYVLRPESSLRCGEGMIRDAPPPESSDMCGRFGNEGGREAAQLRSSAVGGAERLSQILIWLIYPRMNRRPPLAAYGSGLDGR